jgi:hypothetical protein
MRNGVSLFFCVAIAFLPINLCNRLRHFYSPCIVNRTVVCYHIEQYHTEFPKSNSHIIKQKVFQSHMIRVVVVDKV